MATVVKAVSSVCDHVLAVVDVEAFRVVLQDELVQSPWLYELWQKDVTYLIMNDRRGWFTVTVIYQHSGYLLACHPIMLHNTVAGPGPSDSR